MEEEKHFLLAAHTPPKQEHPTLAGATNKFVPTATTFNVNNEFVLGFN